MPASAVIVSLTRPSSVVAVTGVLTFPVGAQASGLSQGESAFRFYSAL